MSDRADTLTPKEPSQASLLVLLARGLSAVAVLLVGLWLLSSIIVFQPASPQRPMSSSPVGLQPFTMQELVGGEWQFVDGQQTIRMVPLDEASIRRISIETQETQGLSGDVAIEHGEDLIEVMRALGATREDRGSHFLWTLEYGPLVAQAISKDVNGIEKLFLIRGHTTAGDQPFLVEVAGEVDRSQKSPVPGDRDILPLPDQAQTIAVRRDNLGVQRSQLVSMNTSSQALQEWLEQNGVRVETMPREPNHWICSLPDLGNADTTFTHVYLMPQESKSKDDLSSRLNRTREVEDSASANDTLHDPMRVQPYLAIITCVPDEAVPR